MQKTIKSFIYIIACAIVFLVLVKFYGGSIKSESAIAFEWEKPINVYFIDANLAKTKSCEATIALKRIVPNAETLGLGAIEALIKGLTKEESMADQYVNSVNPNTIIQKFEIKNGVAYIDFNNSLSSGIAGSCKVAAIRSQIERTLVDLPDIDSVVISINGQTEGILEP